MRLFVALDIDPEIQERISSFAASVAHLAPDARFVAAQSLHVTLKFIGEQPESKVAGIKEALSSVNMAALDVSFRGTGFFPNLRSARVFWVGIEASAGLADLSRRVDSVLNQLGIPSEKRAFSPHLTLARARDASGAPGRRRGDKPNAVFAALQEKIAAMEAPGFGTMTAREFFLFQSHLTAKGAIYTKIASFAAK